MSLHHWMKIEFRNGTYVVTHPDGVKKFKEKLELLKWIDKFLVGRRKMRDSKPSIAALQLAGCDEKCSVIHGGRSWED